MKFFLLWFWYVFFVVSIFAPFIFISSFLHSQGARIFTWKCSRERENEEECVRTRSDWIKNPFHYFLPLFFLLFFLLHPSQLEWRRKQWKRIEYCYWDDEGMKCSLSLSLSPFLHGKESSQNTEQLFHTFYPSLPCLFIFSSSVKVFLYGSGWIKTISFPLLCGISENVLHSSSCASFSLNSKFLVLIGTSH